MTCHVMKTHPSKLSKVIPEIDYTQENVLKLLVPSSAYKGNRGEDK